MPWCKRCEGRYDRIERENVRRPTICGACARAIERERIEKIKKTNGVI
jgi:hypothetical protein